VGDLGSAAEAVGDDRRGGCGVTHGRQQDALSGRVRQRIVAALETEIACESATSGIWIARRDTGGRHHRAVGLEAHDGVLVAMGLHSASPATSGGAQPD
jgi:hypothetical protein